MSIKDTYMTARAVNFLPEQASFVLAKNQRLTSAMYMVTNLFPDAEPLKWKLRDLSLSLLSEINIFFGPISQGVLDSNFLPEKSFKILEDILSYISVALSDGNISPMNLQILKQEYESLKNIILADTNTQNFSAFVLAGEAWSVKNISAPTERISVEDKIKEQPAVSSTPLTKSSFAPTSNQNVARKVVAVSSELGDRGGRKESIKQFLKGRDWTSIKDISRSIPDCSVKTVQRDLVELVNLGALEKVGERRWSRYRLIG